MPRIRVHNIAVSLDGYAAGPDQSLDNPLGVGGRRLHEWTFATRSWRAMHGLEGGDGGIDDDAIREGDVGVGASIMGRNMFGPVRGPWGAEDWRGWWGDNPPYHHPVFVLTHHPREPIEMAGGTTFHFVHQGIEAALERAVEAAAGADVRVTGGPGTIRQYLRSGLVDSLGFAVVPVVLGSGERLLGDLTGYECVEHRSSPAVMHVRLARAGSAADDGSQAQETR